MGLITGKNRRNTQNMARRPRGYEKIHMDEMRFGYFPQRFTWRGHRYAVQAVERCWTVSRKRLGNKVERLCFRVRCAANGHGSGSDRAIAGGTLILYQDLNTNTWHMEKVVSRS